MPTRPTLLLVEDNEDDEFLMKRALQDAGVQNALSIVSDGEEAIEFLGGTGRFSHRNSPLPALVFLDLNLPIKSGFEVLAWIRKQPALGGLIVVVLTSSEEPADIKKCYHLGANSYLVKPPTAQELVDLAKSFKWFWLEFNRFEPLAKDVHDAKP